MVHSYVFALVHVLEGVCERATNGKEREKEKRKQLEERWAWCQG